MRVYCSQLWTLFCFVLLLLLLSSLSLSLSLSLWLWLLLLLLLLLWLLSFFCFFFFFLPFSLVFTTVETFRCVHRCTLQLFIRGRLFQCLVAVVTYLSMRYPAYKLPMLNV